VDKQEEEKQRSLERLGKEHLGNVKSMRQDQHRANIRAVQDQHDEQLEEGERLSPREELQNMKDLRRGELLNHKKKVKALEKKHARMITMLDRVVDSQDNQLRHQKFEMGELQQEVKEMKEVGVEQLRELKEHTQEAKELRIEVKEQKKVVIEQERKHCQELKEMKEIMDIGEKTAERLKVENDAMKVEHDARVHKLEEDNKDLKSQVARFNVDWKETC